MYEVGDKLRVMEGVLSGERSKSRRVCGLRNDLKLLTKRCLALTPKQAKDSNPSTRHFLRAFVHYLTPINLSRSVKVRQVARQGKLSLDGTTLPVLHSVTCVQLKILHSIPWKAVMPSARRPDSMFLIARTHPTSREQ